MKFLATQLTYLLTQRSTRQNLAALGKYVLVLAGVIAVYSTAFHFLMAYEGRSFSWVTGIYWTLTVMSTLGFGDITFESDVGRLFSVIVLLSGIVLLLIVLPFAFIRFFYAPWLEAQLQARAPRSVPTGTKGHVILCGFDSIAEGLVRKFASSGVPHFVIEPDPVRAGQLRGDGVSVIAGQVDEVQTYERMNVGEARAVIANRGDPENTNVTLTIREASRSVPVLATAEHVESIDLLELAGATQVFALKQRLGERLANRASANHAEAHVVGRYRDLRIAEFSTHGTPLVGRSIRESGLRETLGVSIVGVWERGSLAPASPDLVMTEHTVPVVVGSESQLRSLNAWLEPYDRNESPVLVLGGGKVGRAASAELRRRGVKVHLVERDTQLGTKLEGVADRVLVGEAADLDVLVEAGIMKAPSVLLTTNDDAMNIYLCIYCRRLNPELRIVSRITHQRNLEAIHRAGADFVLSYASLGEESVLSYLHGRHLISLGEGIDLFSIPVPRKLSGKTLAQSAIGARTGLNVVALRRGDETLSNPPGPTVLEAGCELVAIGTDRQRRKLERIYRV